MRCVIIPNCDSCPYVSYTYGETSCKKMNYETIAKQGQTADRIPIWCPLPTFPKENEDSQSKNWS